MTGRRSVDPELRARIVLPRYPDHQTTGDTIMCKPLLIAATLVATVGAIARPAFAEDACQATTRDQNIAIARQWHEEVINRRNPAVLETILADSVVHHAAGGYPEEMDASGVKTMMADFLGAFSDLSYSFDLWIANGDLVVRALHRDGDE
jgi:hypothetical protein